MSEKEEKDLKQTLDDLLAIGAKVGRPLWVIACALTALGFGAAGYVHKIDDLKTNGSDNFRQFQREQEMKDQAFLKLLGEHTTAIQLLNDQNKHQEDWLKRLEDRRGH